MLTKAFPASRDNAHDHARAEHREYAGDNDDQPGAVPKYRDRNPSESEDSSSQYGEGHRVLEGWSAPALGRDQMSSFAGQPSIKGRNESIRMMLLCFIHFGITFTWYDFSCLCLPSCMLRGIP